MRKEALVAFKEWNAMTDRILLKSGTVVSDAVRNRTREHENGGVPTFRVGDYAAKWRLERSFEKAPSDPPETRRRSSRGTELIP